VTCDGRREGLDFFISYTAADRRWAEWIAWQLREAGYHVFVQAWNIGPGHDFVHEMEAALRRADRVLLVLSAAYVGGSAFGEAEWRPMFRRDPSGRQRLVIPIRVTECEQPGLLSGRVRVDLFDRDEQDARVELLAGVRGPAGPPRHQPAFPGRDAQDGESAEPPFPGTSTRSPSRPHAGPSGATPAAQQSTHRPDTARATTVRIVRRPPPLVPLEVRDRTDDLSRLRAPWRLGLTTS